MALDPRLILAGKSPDIGAAFSNALMNVQRGQNISQAAEQAPIQNRLLTAQAGQAEAGVEQSQQLNNIRSLALFGQELAGDTNLDSIRAKTLQRIQDVSSRGGTPSDSQELLSTVIDNPNLSPEQKIAEVQSLSKQANENAIRFGAIKASAGGGFAVKSSAPIIDPETGQLSIPTFDPNTNTTKLIPLEGAIQQTPQQKLEAEAKSKIDVATQEAALQGQTAAVKAAVAKGSKIFDKIQPIGLAISNYDEAIAAIDAGAETGVVDSLLPSFKKASIQLDNVVKRLGLDVVGNTTFGALSESELKFALKAAIPDNLQPADLKEWLIAKRNAQQKVKARVEEAAAFLSEGTNTIKDWIEVDAARQLNTANQQTNNQASPTAAQPVEAPAAQPQIDLGQVSDEDLFNF